MKLNKHRRRLGRQKGFTLVELTLVMGMTLVLSAALMMMLRSHITFMRVLSSYEFLRDDAPQMNLMLTGILGQATEYKIYQSTGDAQSDSNAVTSSGTAVRLRFRNPDGTFAEGLVSFEGGVLNYYSRPVGTSWPGSASWTISEQATAVDFDNTSGILLVTLTGPYGEEITYAGTGE